MINKGYLVGKGVDMLEKEVWKSVGVFKNVDFTGYYEVSTFGNVRSVDRNVKYKDGRTRKYKGCALSEYKNKRTGYIQVVLSYKGTPYTISVHELVMNTHRPNPNPEIYTDINHIDEDKTNNMLYNLEWATHKGNCNHGTAIERRARSQRNGFVPIVQLDFSGNIINVYYSTKEIDNSTYKRNCIIQSINKETYIYKKYFWIRLDKYNNLSFDELTGLINNKLFKKKDSRKNKKVVQLSKDGEFIREYCSITDAAKEMGVLRQAIWQCASGKFKLCKGYRWEYK